MTFSNDTNENLDKEKLIHVFNRFYRMDSSRNSATGCYGIGLSIDKAIIDAHDGTIRAENRTGNDFMVSILLPYRKERAEKR